MMLIDWIVALVASFVLGLKLADVLVTPFLVGRRREPYEAADCLAPMIGFAVLLLLCGRIFGWW